MNSQGNILIILRKERQVQFKFHCLREESITVFFVFTLVSKFLKSLEDAALSRPLGWLVVNVSWLSEYKVCCQIFSLRSYHQSGLRIYEKLDLC